MIQPNSFEFSVINSFRAELFFLLSCNQPRLLRICLKCSLGLIYSHCPISLNISSESNDFGFNSFQKKKIDFSNSLGSKFDLGVKLVNVNLGLLLDQTWYG